MLRNKTVELRPSQTKKKSNKLEVLLKSCFKFVRLLTLLFKAIDKFWDVLKGLFHT